MRHALSLACGLALVVAGCGGGSGGQVGPDAPKERVALQEIGEVYRIYTLTNSKPPAKFADLKPLKNLGAVGVSALETGVVVVRYGATMAETAEGPAKARSEEILAYEKKVPEGGGEVLMLDRTIRKMTADEFKAARKAGKG